ncbi:MAG: tyrosine-type recombinase/integrase [Acidimicrobiia bacterium]
MGSNKRTRTSGSVRKLPSGKWQPRMYSATGERTALGVFATKAEADKVLRAALAAQARGAFVDPRRGKTAFATYATTWLEHRPNLRPRTRELYDGQLRNHLLPTLGATELAKITPMVVRAWHAKLSNADAISPTTVAKCYRLLKTIMGTAVDDELIPRNPCIIKGAGVERSPERPIATIAEVDRLVAIAEPHLKALVLMATYTSLRLGELSALTRRHLDLEKATVTVTSSASELADGTRIIGDPKSYAGRRTVSVPAAILPMLADHLDAFAEPGRDGLVFVGPKGGPLRRGNFNHTWRKLAHEAGLEGLRFHDLRHTGNTLAAMTGASTKELMSRMGHSSTRAALGYQHATEERERLIASKLSEMILASR